ncbi:MAG: sulfite exporter TauE/SafE family protein [Leptolyngbyaceae bacterium]|nr:sulfite exporter TauE/SafE family protein [Leptolyngbyaceae bacterium]
MEHLLLIAGIGFLGSFGHCVGMCGPLAIALSLSQQADKQQQKQASVNLPNCHDCDEVNTPDPRPCNTATAPPPRLSPQTRIWPPLRFHLLLNLGRLLSYTLVGVCIGIVGQALLEGGQLAGVGSDLRRILSIMIGLLLIWFGLVHVNPALFPRVPVVSLLRSVNLHDKLQQAMSRLSLSTAWWTPLMLGLLWGLIPCGFLYVAQWEAVNAASGWLGGATMLAFGLGTLPSMVGIGLASGKLGATQRHQLFQLGGWLTILVGCLTLLRTGDQMVDYSGHGALLCLIMALLARPISKLWSAPLQYRRILGVGAFVLSVVHVLHMLEHTWSWQIQALWFMLPQHQWGIGFGIGAFLLMLPLAFTSFDGAQKRMGLQWRRLHLLSVPALALVVPHCLLVGSNYLGRVQLNWVNGLMITALLLTTVGVMLTRSPLTWSMLSMEKWYVPPKR